MLIAIPSSSVIMVTFVQDATITSYQVYDFIETPLWGSIAMLMFPFFTNKETEGQREHVLPMITLLISGRAGIRTQKFGTRHMDRY